MWRENDEKKFKEELPIVFYHEAFVDLRFSPPRLRIFSLNPCINYTDFTFAKIETQYLKLVGEPLERECPWSWAPTCFYNTYALEASLARYSNLELKRIRKVTILLEHMKQVQLPVKMIHPKRKDGLTVCVQPVYWYSQFQNIVLFVESWRNQGATHFIVYFHSATEEVWMVLEYYQKLELMTIKPWPSFGHLPNKFPEINSQVYRIGHTMAANICILEMSTSIGAIVDFDELILPTHGSPNILTTSKHLLGQENVGALRFEHIRIQLTLSRDQKRFDPTSIKNPILVDKRGPTKLIFNTSTIAIIDTHSVKKFTDSSYKTANFPHGALVHYRYNGGVRAENQRRTFEIFEKQFEQHMKNIHEVTDGIFGNMENVYNPNVILELNKCITEITRVSRI